jgi:hypothetical protein
MGRLNGEVCPMGRPIMNGDFVQLTDNRRSLERVAISDLAGHYGVITDENYTPTSMGIKRVLLWVDNTIVYVYRHHVYPRAPRPDVTAWCPEAPRSSLGHYHAVRTPYRMESIPLYITSCTRCPAIGMVGTPTGSAWAWY